MKELDYQNIVDLLIDRKGKWSSTRKNPHESIARGSLTEKAKVWFYFICLVLLPSKHLSTVRVKEVILLYAILKGYKFSVGKIIKNSILSYFRSSYKGLVPHLATITRLCILGGVEGDWEEEETCPKASPLILIRVTKGPKIEARRKTWKLKKKKKKKKKKKRMTEKMSKYSWKAQLKSSKKGRGT